MAHKNLIPPLPLAAPLGSENGEDIASSVLPELPGIDEGFVDAEVSAWDFPDSDG